MILNKYFVQLPAVFLLRFGLTDKLTHVHVDTIEILITLRSNMMGSSMRQGPEPAPIQKIEATKFQIHFQ